MFDRRKLRLLPLAQRIHDLDISIVRDPRTPPEPPIPGMAEVAAKLAAAKAEKASIVMMIGAHVIRAGVQNYLIDLMKRGYISCLAMNGAGVIHDFELALIGATTESVARYIRDGRFGLWAETGRINDVVNRAWRENTQAGLGASMGREIENSAYPHKDISLLAWAHKLNIPVTVHVGIGFDIIHAHPNFDGAATGALSYNDFLIFAEVLNNLEHGAILNFGSAVMAPEVFLKALSMARNLAAQEGRKITDFTTVVCDLRALPANFGDEPSKCCPEYYFRPWKTMLVRTVQDGGRSFYFAHPHGVTVPGLWQGINSAEAGDDCVAGTGDKPVSPPAGRETASTCAAHAPGESGGLAEPDGKILDLDRLAEICADLRKNQKRIIHCHGCFDLMHPGHIKYFQAAKRMGDVLVVTLTDDRYIDKGPGRPVFNRDLRAESIAALECVDYVAVNKWPTAEETLRLLRPHCYVKGQEFEKLEDKTGKIQREYEVVREIGAEMRFTHEIVFSSTKLLNAHFLNKN